MTAAAPTPAYPPSLMTNLAESVSLVSARKLMLTWIGCVQGLYIVSLLIPSSGRSIASLVQRDFGIPYFAFVLLFLFAIGHYLRGLRPRYSLITSLIGQASITVMAAYYVGQGQVSITVLASHGGTFLVCYLAIASTAQEASYRRTRIRFHNLLMPAMSITLALYAIGMGLQPNAGLAGWIAQTMGSLPRDALNVWLAVGAGYIFHNHIEPRGLYLALVSHYLYVLMAIIFLITTPGVAVVAVMSHFIFAVTSSMVILIATQEVRQG